MFIETFDKLTREIIEHDENLLADLDKDGNIYRLYLRENEKVGACVYGDDNDISLFKIGSKEDILLFQYLFRRYNIWFIPEDYTDIALYQKGGGCSAYYWEAATRFMLQQDGWTNEERAKIESQREEWIEEYEYFHFLEIANKLIEIEEELNKIDSAPEVKESQINYLENIYEYIIENVLTMKEKFPSSLIISIINRMCEYYKNKDKLNIIPDKKEETKTKLSNGELPF
jgi:hypothetical protein